MDHLVFNVGLKRCIIWIWDGYFSVCPSGHWRCTTEFKQPEGKESGSCMPGKTSCSGLGSHTETKQLVGMDSSSMKDKRVQEMRAGVIQHKTQCRIGMETYFEKKVQQLEVRDSKPSEMWSQPQTAHHPCDY